MKSFVPLFAITWLAGCDADLDTNRRVEPYTSFGGVLYREACQREAYLGQLAQRDAHQRSTVDVSGGLGHAVCVSDLPAPPTAPEQLKAIQVQKAPLVDLVDAILPKPFLSDLQDFLVALVPLDDDVQGMPGTMPRAINGMGRLLDTMAKDPDLGPALVRFAQRIGYRPTRVAAGLLHTVLEYPNLDSFFGQVLALIAPGGSAENEFKQLLTALSMEMRSSIPVANPLDPERTLRLGLDLLLQSDPALSSGPTRPLVARDVRGMAQVETVNGQLSPPFVDQDGDGLADIDSTGRFVDAQGAPLQVATPFVAAGITNDPAPRDALGRALVQTGSAAMLYHYLDLDGTVLSGLLHELKALADPAADKILGLVYGLSSLMGPRATQTKMYLDPMGGMLGALTYSGYDTSQAALLDLLHAFLQLLGDPNIDQTLQATATLLGQYEPDAARLVGAMLEVSARAANHPEAQILATSTLYDDMVPLLVRILRVPGLAKDVVAALDANVHPSVKGIGPMIARMMTARNQLDFNHQGGPSFSLIGGTGALDNIDPVDRTQPDVDYNRSLMQRIAHLIHDANGLQYCNKEGAMFRDPLIGLFPFGPYHKCDLFQVDDLALFYVLNMASQSVRSDQSTSTRKATTYLKANFCEQIKDGVVRTSVNTGAVSLQTETGISGFTCFPESRALNRALFLRPQEQSQFMQQTTDANRCIDGDLFTDVHDLSLFAWETTLPANPGGSSDTFYDAMRPVIDAFAKHDECIAFDASGMCTKSQNAAKLVVDLFSMLHEHWSSPSGSYFGHSYQQTPGLPRFAHTDNLASYEVLIAEVLADSDLVRAVIAASPTLQSFTVDGAFGQPGLPALLATASYLFDPEVARVNGVASRNGMTSTVESDGTTPVAQVTPYYLLADAYAHKRQVLAQAGAAGAAWKAATSALVDQLLTVDQSASVSQFQNRRFRAITLKVIDFLRARIASHSHSGDLLTWVHKTLTQDTADMLGGPVVAAFGDFAAKMESDPNPAARQQLYSLLGYLADEAGSDVTFQTALTAVGDDLQCILDDRDLVPVAHLLGQAMDPVNGPTMAGLGLMKQSHDVDLKQVLLTLLRRLYQPDATGAYPASTLADLLAQLDRTHPLDTGPLNAGDYQSILGQSRDFLIDSQRGLTRFLAIIKARGPH